MTSFRTPMALTHRRRRKVGVLRPQAHPRRHDHPSKDTHRSRIYLGKLTRKAKEERWRA
jgi:hypothetical protein